MQPKISIIVSIAGINRAIGDGANLVVRISDDMKRFKSLTIGHAVIMGRKTFESIGKPLPGRENFIVTRNSEFEATGTAICSSLDEAISKASAWESASPNSDKEIFLIGGGEIYAQGLPKTDKLYLTLVESDATGDVFFPDYSEFKKAVKREDRVDEKTGLKYSWIDLER